MANKNISAALPEQEMLPWRTIWQSLREINGVDIEFSKWHVEEEEEEEKL